MDTSTPTPELQPSPKATAGTAEKYIRTFAGDMETLQAGGTPDLVVLAEPTMPTPDERLVEASPVVPVQAPAPIEMPLSEPMPAYVPPPEPLAHVETYASDFADRVKETSASPATVLAAEQDSAPRASQIEPEKSSKNVLYIVAGCVLLLIGGVGAYLAYTRYVTIQTPVVVTSSVSAPIFVDERELVAGSGPTLLQAIEKSVAEPLAQNKVRLLYVASTSDSSIFSLLSLSAPDILLRNIDAVGSMAGIVSVGGSQSPFFILSVSSYSNTFSGMLSWEKTMSRDLGKLFPAYPPTSVSTTTSATTTPIVRASVPAFVDAAIANHDVRVYRDVLGRDIVLYGYWNQTTLVIARDAAAFTELVQRLATSRAQK